MTVRADLAKYCGKCGRRMRAKIDHANALWWDCSGWGRGWPWKKATWDHDIEYVGTVGPWPPKEPTPDHFDRRTGIEAS